MSELDKAKLSNIGCAGGHNRDKCCDRFTGNYNTREELIAAAVKYKAQKVTYERISYMVGVSESTVYRLINGDPKTVVYISNGKKSAEDLERAGMKLFNSLWTVRTETKGER